MKKKNIKKIPAYAWGAKETGAVTTGADLLQTAASGNKVTAGSVLGAAGKGAAAGAAFGPWGAVIGGAVGAIAGGMGTGGKVDETTGVYEDPSGIASLFGHSKSYIRNKAGRVKNGIAARQLSENYAADYYSENGYNDFTMAANGGVIPTTNAYLDDGELLRTPDGSIGSIPEEGKPQDSNLLNVPVGTQVLSDKLKVPGTNKTFAQKGKELMKKSNSKSNDIYAKNSSMLNERNNQMLYTQLLQQQEQLKASKGIKGATKKYANGTPDIDNDPRSSIEQIQQAWYVPSTTNRLAPNYLSNMAKMPVNTSAPAIPSNRVVVAPKVANYGSWLDTAAALSGPLENIFSPKSERAETFTYTPRYNPTNYDISDQLAEVDLSNSIARYNQANINPNTGAGMAFGLQSAVNRNKAISQLYNNKRNIENQMAGANTSIYNQWANQYAGAKHQASIEQAQNDATARNIRRKGLGDLSTRIQQISKDRRMTSRDQAMLEAMIPYLEYGMTSQNLQNLVSGLKK